MSKLPEAHVSITAFDHMTGYQFIRPKSDGLISPGQFLDMIVTAPTFEEAKARLSEHTLSWDYYTNWMDGQKEIATELSTRKSLRKKIKKAPLSIANYLKGIQLSQRMIELGAELDKYPSHSTKWEKVYKTYSATFNELKETDPDYTTLFLETPSTQTYKLSPFILKLAETGYYLALVYVAFYHLQESVSKNLTDEEKDQHFQTGFGYLDQACVRGSNAAIITMGDIYQNLFTEIESNAQKSQKMYKHMITHFDLATRRGNPNARAKLGNALLIEKVARDETTGTIHGTSPQPVPALKFLSEAASSDSTFAHFYLGDYHLTQELFKPAIEHFERAAQNEHIPSMQELATLYTQKANKAKATIAAQYRTKAAETMYMIGQLYENGHCLTGKPDLKEAQTHYLKSLKIKIGDRPEPQIKSALALSRLSLRQDQGPSGPNTRLALVYLKKATDLGDINALIQIACFLIQPNDPTLKEDWDQGRLYLDRFKQAKPKLNPSDSLLITNTIQNLIAQTQLVGQESTDRRLRLNEFILDLAKLAHQKDTIIAAYKTIGLIYAYEILDKRKAISYYKQAISSGDLNSYLDMGFIYLDGNDPKNLPDIGYAMQTFKTGVKSGLDLTTNVIDTIEAKLFSYEHVPEMKDAFNKAIYYDIKFLKDYNWLERTFFSGTFASSEDQNQIPLYIQWLEIETVLDTNHTEDLLAAFKRNYSKACAQSI